MSSVSTLLSNVRSLASSLLPNVRSNENEVSKGDDLHEGVGGFHLNQDKDESAIDNDFDEAAFIANLKVEYGRSLESHSDFTSSVGSSFSPFRFFVRDVENEFFQHDPTSHQQLVSSEENLLELHAFEEWKNLDEEEKKTYRGRSETNARRFQQTPADSVIEPPTERPASPTGKSKSKHEKFIPNAHPTSTSSDSTPFTAVGERNLESDLHSSLVEDKRTMKLGDKRQNISHHGAIRTTIHSLQAPSVPSPNAHHGTTVDPASSKTVIPIGKHHLRQGQKWSRGRFAMQKMIRQILKSCPSSDYQKYRDVEAQADALDWQASKSKLKVMGIMNANEAREVEAIEKSKSHQQKLDEGNFEELAKRREMATEIWELARSRLVRRHNIQPQHITAADLYGEIATVGLEMVNETPKRADKEVAKILEAVKMAQERGTGKSD